MCGIVGISSKRQPLEESEFLMMRDTMAYRGPDDSGIYSTHDQLVRLGHRRLSILDLSSNGQQPLQRGELSITYNGEIYNFKEIRQKLIKNGYKFHSNTDTEVILYAFKEWGTSCLDYFNGMFAFAIFNEKDRSIFIARDRLGIKPLFFYYDDHDFIFSSEIKAILKCNRVDKSHDQSSFLDYFTFGYIPAPKTSYNKISKLKPGHYLQFKENKISIKKYWDIDPSNKNNLDFNQASEELRHRIKKAVNAQTISDVPLGFLLSGGLDSSTVTAYADISNEDVKTFSMGFEPIEHSELKYAKILAESIGAKNTHAILTHESIKSSVSEIVKIYDEPYADSSAIPTLKVCELARTGVTVALSGDGGDEILGGYLRYSITDLRKNWPYLYLPKSIHRLLNGFTVNKKGHGTFNFLLSNNPLERFTSIVQYFDPIEKHKILNEGFIESHRDYDHLHSLKEHWDESFDEKSRYRYLDLKTYLPDDILTKVDRASMQHSLELRPPLLDHELVEFCFSLPSDFHNQGSDLKFLFKNSVKKTLPPEILNKPKQGFSLPYKSDVWKKELTELKNEYISDPNFDDGIFNRRYIDENFEKFSLNKMWSTLIFFEWLSQSS